MSSPVSPLSISSLAQLAQIVHSTPLQLRYWAFTCPDSKKYREFKIPKKRGGERTIAAPAKELAEIQRHLAGYLAALVKVPEDAHGFVKGRSIVTNASMHLSKRHVLNIDLANFFPSINFGRIRGLFLANPFCCPNDVATLIARIVCRHNSLPQGAPTSPILSNMICRTLDKSLRRFSRDCGCIYSRYADDITISTRRTAFPKQIAEYSLDNPGLVRPSSQLIDIIKSRGFSINTSKTRLQFHTSRQEVTGIIVNKQPNVRRALVRQVRAMIHAWRKYGLPKAAAEYQSKYSFPPYIGPDPEGHFIRVVKGKMAYIKMVKGNFDPVYANLVKTARSVSPKSFKEPIDATEYISECIWIVEDKVESHQGTGFVLNGVGLVTCDHVLGKQPFAYRHDDVTKHYPLKVLWRNAALDLAVTSLPVPAIAGLDAGESERLVRHQRVMVAGFPSYSPGHEPYIDIGGITAFRIISTIRRFLISSRIVAGTSGGPVVDQYLKVVGIAVTGADSMAAADDDQTEKHGVIPIEALLNENKKVPS